MAWGKHGMVTGHLPRVNSYEQALDAFNARAEFAKRGEPTKRWLNSRRSQWIRQTNGSIAFALNGWEAVTYRDNGEIEVSTGNTEGDSDFVNALSPFGVGVDFHTSSNPAKLLWSQVLPEGEDRYWALPRYGEVTLTHSEGSWRPKSGTEALIIPEIDRRAARAALIATKAKEFFDYARAIVAMGGWRDLHEKLRGCRNLNIAVRTRAGRVALLERLKDEAQWHDVLCDSSLYGYAYTAETAFRTVILSIRQVVYAQVPGVVHMIEHPYLDGKEAMIHWAYANKAHMYART